MYPSASRLRGMRRRIESHYLPDTCVIQSWAASQDSVGQPIASYTDGHPVRCALGVSTGAESPSSDLVVTSIDASLRLPAATVLDGRDRVKVTHRYGERLATPLVYEVLGQSLEPTCLKVQLRVVSA